MVDAKCLCIHDQELGIRIDLSLVYAACRFAPNGAHSRSVSGRRGRMQVGGNRIVIDEIPLEGQQVAWRSALNSICLEPFLLSGSSVSSGDFLSRTLPGGARMSRLRSNAQSLCHKDDSDKVGDKLFVLLFSMSKPVGFKCNDSIQSIADGQILIVDIGNPWSLEIASEFELFILETSCERLFGRIGLRKVDLPVTLQGGPTQNLAAVLMRSVAEKLNLFQQFELASAETAIIELLADALLSNRDMQQQQTTRTQAGHLHRVHAAIEARLGNTELSIGEISDQEGLSTRYVQRLFERQNITFSTYLRKRRLERCRLDLIDLKQNCSSISEIAFRWGFRDQATFSRAFSGEYGVSPRELRKSVAASDQSLMTRGRPYLRPVSDGSWPGPAQLASSKVPADRFEDGKEFKSQLTTRARYHLPVNKDTVHWGYLSRSIPPKLCVGPDARVTVETLTQHAFDDHDRMIKGDAGAESVFEWSPGYKAVNRRGAGPLNASIFGRGAGEGFGVHICTGPIYVSGAEPGDVLEVQILDLRPRPCANPLFKGKAFGSNAAAWWGFQYGDLLDPAKQREVITIFETDLNDGAHFAHAVHSYCWTEQVDPFGARHATMDYPGVPVDQSTVARRMALTNIRIPARLHFGFMAVAPREADIVDSIPPGYFGGNIDNWRATKGTTLYLPVAVPGALFSVGDPHFAQGDGEISGTALELSLTGDFRLILHKKGKTPKRYLWGLACPLLETPNEWVLHGFSYSNYLRELGRNAQAAVYKNSSVDLAFRNAFRVVRRFLMEAKGLSEDEAITLMSLAVDFGVTQVADGNWGVHAVIRKELF